MQVLLSIMNIKNDDELNNLINKMKLTSNYLIINQVKNKEEIKISNSKVITVQDKGVSKSRNLALEEAEEEIVLLADDDVIYENNYEKIIKDAYKKYKKADIICFYVESKNKNRKIKKQITGKMGLFKIMKIVSPQISMKKSSVEKIKFDENFGPRK